MCHKVQFQKKSLEWYKSLNRVENKKFTFCFFSRPGSDNFLRRNVRKIIKESLLKNFYIFEEFKYKSKYIILGNGSFIIKLYAF